MNIKKAFIRGAMFFSTFLLFSGVSLAASSYGVTETTATVGTAASLEIEYTVDTGEQTWADGDTLTVQLPANFPQWASLTYTVEYDDDVDNDATNETAITAGGGNGQYAVSTDTITIKWDVSTWGAVSNGASTIRILITDGAIPQYADSTSTFTFGGATADGGDTNPTGTDDVDVSAADAAATLSLGSNAFVGNTGSTTLNLSIAIALASSDTVVFTLPSHLSATGLSSSTTDTFGGAGSFTCTASGQVVTCTAGGAITAGTGTIVMSGIYATAADSGATITSLAVNDASNSGADISSDSSGSVTDVIGSSSGGSITVKAPNDFKAVAKEEGILLTWTDPSSGSNVSKIEILRGANENSVSAAPVGLVELGVEEYLDLDVKKGESYSYIIRSRDGSGTYKSSNSETLTITFTGEDATTEDDSESSDSDSEENSEDTDSNDESSSSSDEASEFSDLDVDHWSYAHVHTLTELNIVKGYSDGSFQPNVTLNRAEGASLLARLYVHLKGVAEVKSPKTFSDLPSGAWFTADVNMLSSLEIVLGNPDGTFAPNKEINRAEFLTLITRLFGEYWGEFDADTAENPFSDVNKGDWYYETVLTAQHFGVVEGSACEAGTCFNANASITRAEAATMLSRALETAK